MKQMLVLIGGTEMYVPINERLGKLMMQAHKRLNYQKHIAAMRKAYCGRIEVNCVSVLEFAHCKEHLIILIGKGSPILMLIAPTVQKVLRLASKKQVFSQVQSRQSFGNRTHSNLRYTTIQICPIAYSFG